MVLELKEKMFAGEEYICESNTWQNLIEMLRLDSSDEEEINSVIELFDILLERNDIEYGNYTTVKTALETLKLFDIIEIVEKYETMICEPRNEQKGEVKATVSIRDFVPPSVTEETLNATLLDNLIDILSMIRHLPHGEYIKASKHLKEDYQESLNVAKKMVDMFTEQDVRFDLSQLDSLLLSFQYNSLNAYLAMWKMYLSGELLNVLQSGIVTKFMLRECKVESIQLKVAISGYPSTQEKEGESLAMAQIPVVPLNQQTCAAHNTRQITMVCRDCNDQYVCSSCIANDHSGHKFIEIKDFMERKKNNVREIVSRAEAKYAAIEKRLQISKKMRTVHNENIDTVQNKVRKQRDDIVKVIDDWMEENINDCFHIRLQSNSRLDDVDNELEELLKDLEYYIQKCKTTLDSTSYEDFASLESMLMSYLTTSLPQIPHVEQAELDTDIPTKEEVDSLLGNILVSPLVLSNDDHTLLNFLNSDSSTISLETPYLSSVNIWKGRFDGNPSFIKVYKGSPMTWEEFFSEALILKSLKHRQIVRLYEVTGDPVCIAMEYMSNGNLFDFLNCNGASLKQAQLLAYASQIADGMAYVSSERIIHRILTSKNIFVGDAHTVKIANFSRAVKLPKTCDFWPESDMDEQDIKIPLKWSAPECYHCRYELKSDVWSFGITLWEIMSFGKLPYPGMSGQEAIKQATEGYRMPKPEKCEDEVYTIMLKCWNNSPSDRLTFEFLYDYFDDYRVAAEPHYGELNKTKSDSDESNTKETDTVTRRKSNKNAKKDEKVKSKFWFFKK